MTIDADPMPPAPGTSTTAALRGIPSSLIIGAIALLVVLVSLPRFHAHAVDANHQDARISLDVLGAVAFDPALPDELARLDGPGALLRLVSSVPALAHRFPDARSAPDTGQLLHHGYRIDTGFVVEGLESRPALVAWPDELGRTGDAAFALTADGRLFGHENRGLWSSGASPLRRVELSDQGWVELRGPRRP